MGLITNILTTVIGNPTVQAAAKQAAASVSAATTATTTAAAPPAATVAPPPPAAVPPPPAPAEEVDVSAVLNGLAKKNAEKLDWKKSIVDLMKLIGMDSSLSTRKALAKELNYPGDMGDSAKMNVWLHKEVLRQLAANGGKVPADLLD
ncbi:DUF3597 domain-containing protein [Haloferula sp. BvORR071]|uniref:DUF3597 domain-containing protein n=1 Tax=Haloferula sp. BvORR071 TaxID=1396141 RepID=UPI000554626B|nr:DUF3597 domain-containing protein [Haloferula sp. BvORR071]